MREELIGQLIRHEGIRFTAYQDSLGYWTIGVGRNVDKRGGGLNTAEALYLLNNDIDRVCLALDNEIPFWRRLSDVRQRVLADMCFNLGIAGLLKFHNFLGALKNGNYAEAADEMLDSLWGRQVGVRAVNLSDMMRDDKG